MLIPANKIAKYMSTLKFPVEIRDPEGKRLVYSNLSQMHLEKMIEEKLVEAIGSRSRIRYFRLHITSMAKLVMWLKLIFPIKSECNCTVRFVRTEGWGHIDKRCWAYDRWGNDHADYGGCW